MDRGLYSVEVVAYLLAQKILNPNKWFLLRGNHEDELMNGRQSGGRPCLWTDCAQKFGEKDGRMVYDRLNAVFNMLPLAAVVGGKVFCVHGGISRQLLDADLSAVEAIPCPLSKPFYNDALARDLMWSDPTPTEEIEGQLEGYQTVDPDGISDVGGRGQGGAT